MIVRIAQSTTVLLIALLVLSDAGWRASQQKFSKQVDENALVKTVQSSVASKSLNPDVLVVGSSLAYCFTYDVDSASKSANGSGDPEGNASNCAASPYLSKLTNSKVFVVALPGAMASDIENIAESMFAEGKRPKVVIYTAAPRDFVDNLAIDEKPAYTFSARKDANVRQDALKNMVALAVPPATLRRWDSLLKRPSSEHLVDFVVASASQIYEQRAQLKNAFVDFLCAKTNHDRDLWSAQNGIRASEKGKTRFDKDLENYMARYRPSNLKRFRKEAPSLDKFAEVCEKNGAQLVLLNMPLSAENKKIIEASLYDRYKALLTDEGQNTGVVVFDTDTNPIRFDRSKFLDSAHLNRDGSKQLQGLIASNVRELLSVTKRK